MIAVDTNVLVHAHRRDSNWHEAAAGAVRELAEGRAAWAIPWPCLHEFYSVVTHPKIWDPPTPVEHALGQIAAWCESPSLQLLSEQRGYAEVFQRLVANSGVLGPRVHDARIACLCLAGGVTTLWTADRDFTRFVDLRTENPLLRS